MLEHIETKDIAGYQVSFYKYKDYEIIVKDGVDIYIKNKFSNDFDAVGLNADNLIVNINIMQSLCEKSINYIISELKDLLDIKMELKKLYH